MAMPAFTAHPQGTYVRANGTDIHYVEEGRGEPLLLLHAGMQSTNPVWAGHPGAYVSRMQMFTEHFRVIAPDTRGHGRTAHPAGGPISYSLLADDVLALIGALGLDRPMICGFSDGGMIATLAAIRAPEAVRALVNDAGFDYFNPEAPSFAMLRQMLGGRPDAIEADPEAVERFFAAYPMHGILDRLKADHDGAHGRGADSWRALIAGGFHRLTASAGHTFEDFRAIKARTLILTGDRDICCSVEDAVTAYRKLSAGELAILPGHGHYIPDSAIQMTVEFLRKSNASGGST